MNDRTPLGIQLTERPASIGTFFKSKSPSLAEALGTSDLDFLLVDRQHTSVDLETVETLTRAASVNDLPVMVRMATTGFDFVNCLLDAGAEALMIPQVDDPETVRDVVAETQYDEERSLSMGTRAGNFGTREREAYFEWVREDLGIVPQVETGAAVEAASELAAIPSVSALMIGPTDLSLSLGVSKDDPELAQAIDRVIDAARAADCGVGTFATSPAELARYRDEMDFVIYSSDAGMLTSAIADAVNTE